ncbi:hypothetical protein B0H14DRAFT_2785620 [Mycena olivaceomarginata]|nr:hypothetical protein B0H14DRAFT_2945322 [Mycena olivaceomarginata]KAJ7840311.1 hypothetical protein B0H14DRAFT_2785620 [Mycena olivaceomarginata]
MMFGLLQCHLILVTTAQLSYLLLLKRSLVSDCSCLPCSNKTQFILNSYVVAFECNISDTGCYICVQLPNPSHICICL